MSKIKNDFCWHDGVLTDISFSADKKGKSVVHIDALFYKDDQDPKRAMYQITCNNVSRFNCSLDTSDLKDNMNAGNISNGYLKGNILWLYFSDGLLEVQAKKFDVTKK